MDGPDVLFDRFVIERVAGHGGMGTVYRARDARDGRPVALKVLSAEGGAAADRFDREARLLAELHHPGIVRYVAHGRAPQGRFLAMEWLEGEDLEQALARGPLTLPRALALGAAVADALAFAHARGVVHRDVKPSNLYLVGGDAAGVRILDFGVARWHPASITATRAGSVLGTLSYMAPEQARGEPDVDARADMFSLACVLFECVTGKPAFTGDHAVAVLARILFEPAPRASEVCDGVPPDLDALLAQMMAKHPAQRPADARLVADRLRALAARSQGDTLTRVWRPPALTVGERRLVSVILLGPMRRDDRDRGRRDDRPPERAETGPPRSQRAAIPPPIAPDGEPLATMRTGGGARPLIESEPLTSAATLEAASVDEALGAIRAVALPWGAAPELLLDGSVVVLLQGDRPTAPRRSDSGPLSGQVTGGVEPVPIVPLPPPPPVPSLPFAPAMLKRFAPPATRYAAPLSQRFAPPPVPAPPSASQRFAPPSTRYPSPLSQRLAQASLSPLSQPFVPAQPSVSPLSRPFAPLSVRPPPPSGALASPPLVPPGAPPVRSGPATEAAHAAACALALRAAVPDVPIALATGWAEVTGRLPLGEAIDRAAALLSAAGRRAPGPRASVHIDEITSALLDSTFEVRARPGDIDLIGRRDDDGVRTLLGKPTPCVGREVELATLRALLDQCVSEPIARAAVIVGAAGMGKSRLRHELVRHARSLPDPPEVWSARGDSMRPDAPFDLLAQALRRAAGILESDPAPLRRAKLHARIRRHMTGEAALRAAEFLGEVVGAEPDDARSVKLRAARCDPLLMGDQIRRAACDLLGAMCAEAPLVLVLEDLQWGDLPTVHLVDTALRLLPDAPLFVLATARPEVSDLFPSLWSERDAHVLGLSPLTRKASERLVRAALGDRAPPDLTARLVEQAGGNPFFLEELIRAASEGKGNDLPHTVLGMVEARLETLEPEARRVLRAASVFGEIAWEDGVAALLGGRGGHAEARRWSEELCRREILVRRGESRFAGQTELAFRHSLVRETAYATLTPADRALGHILAAGWLERAGEHDATTLAEHYARGGSRARAAELLARAGEQALEGNDFRKALACAARGREHGAAGEPLGALLLAEANAQLWLGDDIARAFTAAQEALELLPEGSPRWSVAAATAANMAARIGREPELLDLGRRVGALLAADLGATVPASVERSMRVAAAAVIGTRLFVAGRNDAAEDLLTAAEAAATRIGRIEPTAHARLVAIRAWQALVRGDPSELVSRAAGALALFEESGDRRSAVNQRMNMGYAYSEIGDYASAERALLETVRVASELGLPLVERSAKHNLGWAIGRMGRLEEGCAMQLAAATAFQAGGDRRMEGACRMYAAALLDEAGDGARALAEARAATSLLGAAPPLRAAALGVLAHIHLRRGAATDALATAREAMRALEELGHIEEGEARIRLVLAEALEATGERAAARRAISDAAARLRARAVKIAAPAHRASFLRNVPENARTLALFQAWCPDDDLPDGDAPTAETLDVTTGIGG